MCLVPPSPRVCFSTVIFWPFLALSPVPVFFSRVYCRLRYCFTRSMWLRLCPALLLGRSCVFLLAVTIAFPHCLRVCLTFFWVFALARWGACLSFFCRLLRTGFHLCPDLSPHRRVKLISCLTQSFQLAALYLTVLTMRASASLFFTDFFLSHLAWANDACS